MTRHLLPLLLAAAASAPPQPSQAKVERAASRIQIDAVAFDGKGAPVLDLKPEELEVWIGHFRVPIDSLTVVTPAASQDRLIVLLLDEVTVPPINAARG